MSNKPKTIEDVLSKLIKHPVWDKTFILRASKKKLEKLKRDLATHNHHASSPSAEDVAQADPAFDAQAMCRVYVFLFQSRDPTREGWGRTLSLLSSTASGRPIYTEEQHALDRLEHLNHVAEAGYACVVVPKKLLLSAGSHQPTKDNFGRTLVMLETGAIQQDQIEYFYHKNTKYTFHQGHLIDP